jgi:hypothetical protein
MNNNTKIQSNPIPNQEWLLSNGYNVVHQKTSVGYRTVDVESGLFVCSHCADVLDQENRAPFDSLCPCCRFEMNADKMLNQAEKLGIISRKR